MIRKLLIAIIAILSVSVSATARDTYARDASVLPKSAQTILANNFKSKVSIVKIDKSFGRVSEYEVVLTDGTEITFDRNGNWDNIEVANTGAIPSALIPEAISGYVKKNQPGQKIIGIDKERSGYEIELSNGVEIKFDHQGQFVRYDK